MEWSDAAVILSVGKYGEHHALVDLLAREHGRWRGLVRGGGGRRLAGVLQPGNTVTARWRARLDAQLGNFLLETQRARAGAVMGVASRLAGLSAACATLAVILPERESHRPTYEALTHVLELLLDPAMDRADWGAALVRLELGVLGELGYGLDLARCAATGAHEDLVYVSPRSGRAVSAAAGRPYRDKLLALPPFLLGRQASSPDTAEVREGLELTGFFLERHILAPHGRHLPPARRRLTDLFR